MGGVRGGEGRGGEGRGEGRGATCVTLCQSGDQFQTY